MKRLGILMLLVGVMFLSSVGVASATSHGGAPASMSLVAMLMFEIEHFIIHMGLTMQALLLCILSPSYGWTMLGDQTLCASVTPLVGLLFGSAAGALATFVLTIVAAALLFVWLVEKAWFALLRVSSRQRIISTAA